MSGAEENIQGTFTCKIFIKNRYHFFYPLEMRITLLKVSINFLCFNSTTGIQTSIVSLDFRVTVLEENGGGDGNSSVADLEVRVETLEGTVDDHETRISTSESDVDGNVFIFSLQQENNNNCPSCVQVFFYTNPPSADILAL